MLESFKRTYGWQAKEVKRQLEVAKKSNLSVDYIQ